MRAHTQKVIAASLLMITAAVTLPVDNATAAMTATRSPNALGVLEYKTGNGGTVSLNEALTPVTSPAGVVTKTKVLIDETQGTVKGYAGIDGKNVPANNVDVGNALASGVLGATGVLAGPSGPATISFVFDFDGKLITEKGHPNLTLIGNVSASVGGYSYISQLGFSDDGSLPQAFLTKVGRRFPTSTGGFGEVYAGATPEVIDATPSSLAGRAKITLQASAGDTITFSSLLSGNAGTQFLPGSQPTDSAGFVDFLNTGTLRVFLPTGYSLVGTSPLLRNFASAVPEPASRWSLALGLLGLAYFVRRQRRSM